MNKISKFTFKDEQKWEELQREIYDLFKDFSAEHMATVMNDSVSVFGLYTKDGFNFLTEKFMVDNNIEFVYMHENNGFNNYNSGCFLNTQSIITKVFNDGSIIINPAKHMMPRVKKTVIDNQEKLCDFFKQYDIECKTFLMDKIQYMKYVSF